MVFKKKLRKPVPRFCTILCLSKTEPIEMGERASRAHIVPSSIGRSRCTVRCIYSASARFSDMLRTLLLWCEWATRLKRQVGGVHDQLNDGPNSIVVYVRKDVSCPQKRLREFLRHFCPHWRITNQSCFGCSDCDFWIWSLVQTRTGIRCQILKKKSSDYVQSVKSRHQYFRFFWKKLSILRF